MTIELQKSDMNTHQLHTIKNELQNQQLQRNDLQQTSKHNDVTQQMVITNGQLHNTTAQLINGQILTTSNGQQIVQAGTQIGQIVHQGQLVQTGNNVQLIQSNGQPAQIVQIHRTGDGDRCEIILQPDISGDTQYYEDGTCK